MGERRKRPIQMHDRKQSFSSKIHLIILRNYKDKLKHMFVANKVRVGSITIVRIFTTLNYIIVCTHHLTAYKHTKEYTRFANDWQSEPKLTTTRSSVVRDSASFSNIAVFTASVYI